MPIFSLSDELNHRIGPALLNLGIASEFAIVTPSARPDLADWQCNSALAAAKSMGLQPRELAERIKDSLLLDSAFCKVEVAGPGFVNIVLSDEFIWEKAAEQIASPRLGISAVKATDNGPVILDFGGPNIAKPLHVGHLRSLLIGESIRRTLEIVGYAVISDIHLGDWGLQMGMLISAVFNEYPNSPYLQSDFSQDCEVDFQLSVEEMELLYTRASAICKDDASALGEARKATAQLQAGHAGYRALWSKMREISLGSVLKTIQELQAKFTILDGESTVAGIVPELISNLKNSHIAIESDGALIVPISADGNTEIPPLLLSKADGSALYATTDLATIVQRRDQFHPSYILYVVDARQSLHFQQVFAVARLANLSPDIELVHIGFGTVNGKDNRPYKTREGGVMRLDELINIAIDKAIQRIKESERGKKLSSEELFQRARQIGIAAVKYADLSSHRLSGYVFDPDRMVSFEGKTGPYLQYACVRISSMLAKAGEIPIVTNESLLMDEEGRTVLLECLRFPDVVKSSLSEFLPNQIAEHAYAVAQKFNKFYKNCPIIHEKSENLRASRLKVAALTYAVLKTELWLLGIDIPEEM